MSFCTVIASVLVFALACTTAGGAVRPTVEVAPQVRVPLRDGWRVQPQSSRNLTELVRDEGGKPAARASISAEPRLDHDEAVRRLREIAEEREGERSFTELCGWPALVRRAKVTSAPPARPSADGGDEPQPAAAEVITIAVAIAATVVRIEGPATAGDGLLELARSLTCPTAPDAGATRQEIESLQKP